ncbi:hypothetical protein [Polyangium aurulentum]|uniref:hypothetical protein n=1 Tax=Polyangium aurulentum TaxID=2567896 RepID=UPI00146A87E8|nr:hypothetical protein [Polyangium aurulentum]UQA56404.1 hypothetical protein E8A73_034575 [Polyangium aurulentum]
MRTCSRSPLRAPRASAFLVRFAALAALAGSAVACGSTPEPVAPTDSGEDRAEKSRINQAKKLIEKSESAYADKDYDGARKYLGQARDLRVDSLEFQLNELGEKIDKRHAKLWANEVGEVIKEGDCAGAFKQIAEPIRDLQSDVFNRELRRLIGGPALACVQTKVDEATTGGKFAEARALVGSDDTKVVLGASAHKKLVAELDQTIFEALKAQLEESLKGRRWVEAMGKLDAWAKGNEVGEAQQAALLGVVRDAVVPEVTAKAQGAVGRTDAPKTLEEVDQLIKLVRWEIMPPDAAAVAKDKAAPEAVATKRQALAVWVEALRLKMKTEKAPQKRWTHGKVAVLPAVKSDAPSKRDLQGASEVWIIGTTKDLALVTEADPAGAPLDKQLEKAVGWVPVARLAAKSTVDWVPPDDQLVGARVWAPLRAPEPDLELGFVTAVKGGDVTVKRIADDKEIQVKKASLRSGRLAAGTKVKAFCQAKTQAVTIQELLPDQRTVRLVCEGGLRKDEVLPGLRARPEDLPPPR